MENEYTSIIDQLHATLDRAVENTLTSARAIQVAGFTGETEGETVAVLIVGFGPEASEILLNAVAVINKKDSDNGE